MARNVDWKNWFTLIELLVVIAIISILMTLLLPSLRKAKDIATELACKNNLRSISQAVNMYVGDNDGCFPIASVNTHGVGWPVSAEGAGGDGGWGAGWGGLFYYHHFLYDYFGARIPPGGQYNSKYRQPSDHFRCPSDRSWGQRSDDISYGTVHYGSGVTIGYSPAEPTYGGAQLRYSSSLTSYWVNAADGSKAGAFWGGPKVPKYGPYILPADAATTPYGSGGPPNYSRGGTILRHGLKLPYISADLSVRVLDLRGTNYTYGFRNADAAAGPLLAGGDPTGGWYRVVPYNAPYKNNNKPFSGSLFQ